MLFLQFMLYLSSFVGALKNEIPEASLELCQLKIKQLSPDILKFRTNHEDNPFTLNCSVVPRSFLLVFHPSSNNWVLIILGTQVIKKKRPVRHVFLDYLSVSYDYALTNITNTKIFFLQMLLLAPASLALMGLLGQKLLPKVGLLGQMELLLTCLLQGALLGLMYSLEQALLEVAGLLKRTLFPRSFL